MDKATLEAEIKAEAWQSVIIETVGRTEGISTEHTYQYWPKDTPVDNGQHNSDLSWQLSQAVIVDNEGELNEAAYYQGAWLGPLYNAYLRWRAINIAPPKYTHSEVWIDATTMRFTEMDVSSGYADDTPRLGTLTGGELVVT